MKQVFIISEECLDYTQFQRLKDQIDDIWPKELPRPILLEGKLTIKVVDL